MSPQTVALLMASIALIASIGIWCVFALRPRAREAERLSKRFIRIHDGYEPAEVHVPAGAPSRLVFFRDETTPCSERVVFPDYGFSAGLPAFKQTAVDLPASEPGVHPFTCEMEMLHGRVVVDERPAVAPEVRR